MSERTDSTTASYKYWAFVSYSSKDRSWGEKLIKAIESYRIPRSLVGLKTGCGTIPERLYPVFRDRDELRAGADLAEALNQALTQARSLIVLCSPNSASPASWVNTEVAKFKAMGRERDVLALIVAGVPGASEQPGMESEECFPRALRYKVGSDGQLTSEWTEPLAADVTREDANPRVSWRKALLKLIARIIDVDFDVLEQRDRKRRRQRIAVWSAAGLALAIAFGSVSALWLDSTRESASRDLAKEAAEKVGSERDLAALLGLYAHHMDRSPAAYDALLTIAYDNPHLVTFLHRGTAVSAVAVSADNRLAAVADCPDADCNSQEIHLYDLETLRRAADPVRIDAGRITKLAFHPDGESLLMLTSTDGSRHQLQALSLKQLTTPGRRLFFTNEPITSVAFSADGRFYSVAMAGGDIKIFGEAGIKCLEFLKPNATTSVFSPNGDYFAAGSPGHAVLLVELATCDNNQLWLHDQAATLAFEPSASRLITVEPDVSITEWDVDSLDEVDNHQLGSRLIGFLQVLSDDGAFLASKSGDDLHVFDLANLRQLKEQLKELDPTELSGRVIADQIADDLRHMETVRLPGHMSELRLISFSPDSNILISVDDSEQVILWKVSQIPLIVSSEPDEETPASNPIETGAKSVDGRLHATVREEWLDCMLIGTLTVCPRNLFLTLTDTETNLEVTTLVSDGPGLQHLELSWIEFTAEGKIAVGGESWRMLWNIDPPYLIDRACRLANRPLSSVEVDQYLGWRKHLLKADPVETCQDFGSRPR